MFRLLELLGGLTLITDLGAGAPLEESLRRAVVQRGAAAGTASATLDVGLGGRCRARRLGTSALARRVTR